MSTLPPKELRIKRKRGADPVDALYVESRYGDGKRRATDNGFVFRRLTRSEDQIKRDFLNTSLSPSSAAATTDQQASDLLPAPGVTPTDPNSGPQLPRRFQLHQSQKRPRADSSVITLVEHKSTRLRTTQDSDQRPPPPSTVAKPSSSPPRKRPATRRLGPPSGVPSREPSRTRDPTPADVARLHAFAAEIELATGAPPKALKYLPKAAPPRYRDRHPPSAPDAAGAGPPDPDAMDTDSDAGAEGAEYVFDTYVREAVGAAAAGAEAAVTTALPTGSGGAAPPLAGQVGVLVLEAADRETWEAWLLADGEGSAGDGEREFASDDEDENAEGYYGADYPENEVSSEDERGEGAYGYRVRREDEEEWDARGFGSDDGEDGGVWSGDEDGGDYGYTRGRWA